MTTLVVVLAAILAMSLPGPARADAGAAGDLTAWIGQERAAAGLPGLQVAGDLVDVATRHAQRMAAENRLHHSPSLGDEVSGWQRVTENVGHGPEARPVHDGFMASSSHRSNILDSGVTQVGVGTARGGDGTLWVAQVFRLPSGETAASPPPSPAPTTHSPPPADPPAPSVPDATATAPPAPGPVTSATPGPPVLTWALADVATAPAPSSIVAPADDGHVRPAPSPATARVLSIARWLAAVARLLDG